MRKYTNNRPILENSEHCGCIYCFEFYSPTEITEWTDENEKSIGMTAICPRCGVDTVVGFDEVSKLNKEWLIQMHNGLFAAA